MSHLTCDLHKRRVVVLEGGRVVHRSGRVVVRMETPNGGEGDVEIAGNVCKTKRVSIGDAKHLDISNGTPPGVNWKLGDPWGPEQKLLQRIFGRGE